MKHREESLTLGLLEAIDNQSDVTQRHIASSMGVALGLANSYLKRCVRKGLIKIEQAPANRYLYYLTPRGFAEKSRLTAEYLSSSFDFYRRASSSCTRVFIDCQNRKYQHVVLCGASELAEIASLRARECGIRVIGLYDPVMNESDFVGIPVIDDLADASLYDACVLTAINDLTGWYSDVSRQVSPERIFIPDILGKQGTT